MRRFRHVDTNYNYASIKMPELPTLTLYRPTILHRYHLELVAEKTTANDVILPYVNEYGVNVTACSGDISLTRCYEIFQRAKAAGRVGRPTRIFYVSDFDPSGFNMPVACARKIELLARDSGLDLDIQLRPIILTHEQCVEYELPRAPIKKDNARSEAKAALFEARSGEGATELDALEALHPGVLDRIIRAEIERYRDSDLDETVEDVAGPLDDDLEIINDAVHDQYREQIEALEVAYAELERRRRSLYHGMETALHSQAPNLSEVEWPEPCNGDEDPDPLFDTTREYIEQCDRFKEHQDKSTEAEAA